MFRKFLAGALRNLLTPPPIPGKVSVRHLGEAVVQKYEATLPAPGAADVVKRVLHLKVDGTDTTTDLPKDAIVAPFGVEDGKTFDVWLIDVDDAGNESPFDSAAVYSATAVDDIPPPSPGMLGVVHVGEE